MPDAGLALTYYKYKVFAPKPCLIQYVRLFHLCLFVVVGVVVGVVGVVGVVHVRCSLFLLVCSLFVAVWCYWLLSCCNSVFVHLLLQGVLYLLFGVDVGFGIGVIIVVVFISFSFCFHFVFLGLCH